MRPSSPHHPKVHSLPAVVIYQPPPPGSSGPLPYPIGDPNGCTISANGAVVDPHATEITSVVGWVNDEDFAEEGDWDGLDWSVTAGKATSGAVNTFTVEVTYNRDDGTSTTQSASVDFRATGFSGSCSGSSLHAGHRRPIARLMPRYYKLLVDVHSLPPSAQGESLLLGGLLGRTPVYLAYDVALSTPTEPVWRDINLPSSAGQWTLRVRASGCGLAGELVLQRLTETEVLPPLIFRCASWSFTRLNFLAPDTARTGAGPAVAVVAEPA